MALKIEPAKKIKISVGMQKNGPLQKFIANDLYERMDPYVPFDSGDLATMVSITTDGKYIIYEVPYAQYQWRGERADGTHKINEENRNRSMHPKASSHWDSHFYISGSGYSQGNEELRWKVNKDVERYIKKRMEAAKKRGII